MNALYLFSSAPWAERLGWTLLHFLWQGLLIAVLYMAVLRLMARSSSPNTRYLLACATLAIMLAAPLVTWSLIQPEAPRSNASESIHGAAANAPTIAIATTSVPIPVRPAASRLEPAQFLPWVVVAWLAGALVFSMRLAGGWLVAARMRSTLVRFAPAEWQEVLSQLGARIGLSRPVRLLVSALVQVPTVVGWLRPVVLMPVGALSGLPVDYLEALLLHELAHIRRCDYLVNIFQSVAEALLFYHPAVWWVSGQIRSERELCCDDAAVSVSGDSLTYASALVRLESCRPPSFSPAVAANGGSLAKRVARLLGQPQPAAPAQMGPSLLAAAVLLAVAWVSIAPSLAQSRQTQPQAPAAGPEFEVASVKQLDQTLNPNKPGGMDLSFVGTSGKAFKISGSRVTITASLHSLISAAYGVKSYQISGTPSWADSLIYQVIAKAPGDGEPTQEKARPMLQSLLADRFQLRLHHETKDLPVYHMTIGKKSSAFKPAAPDETFHWELEPGPGGTMRSKATKESMGDFVQLVGVSADRPVIDKTGLTGDIDYEINYGTQDVRNIDDMNRAIIDAIKDQLGLKLEPAKDSIDTLVVDQAQKPSEN